MDGRYRMYIFASKPYGTLYIGVTNSRARRLELHRSGRGSQFVKQYAVNRLVYVESFETPAEAIQREKQLKRWKRAWKIALIEKDNLDWRDLSHLVVD